MQIISSGRCVKKIWVCKAAEKTAARNSRVGVFLFPEDRKRNVPSSQLWGLLVSRPLRSNLFSNNTVQKIQQDSSSSRMLRSKNPSGDLPVDLLLLFWVVLEQHRLLDSTKIQGPEPTQPDFSNLISHKTLMYIHFRASFTFLLLVTNICFLF